MSMFFSMYMDGPFNLLHLNRCHLFRKRIYAQRRRKRCVYVEFSTKRRWEKLLWCDKEKSVVACVRIHVVYVLMARDR